MVQAHEAQDAFSRLEELAQIFHDRRALGLVRVAARPWDATLAKGAAPLPRGYKRVSFIRHGEGHHNVAQREWKLAGKDGEPYTLKTDPDMKYLDPVLTETGTQQAQDLQPSAAALCSSALGQPVELIVTSTMRRATQTALIGFRGAVSQGVPVLATDLCHEIAGKHTCDKRLSILELSQQFPDVVYFAKLAGGEEDPYWGDGYTREGLASVAARAGEFIDWLMQRPETSVVVAAHSTWLLALFNAAMDVEHEDSRSWFGTGEMRTMILEPLRNVGPRKRSAGKSEGTAAKKKKTASAR